MALINLAEALRWPARPLSETSEQTSVSLCLKSAPYWWLATVSTGSPGRMLSSRAAVRLLAKQPLVRSMGLDSHICSACTHLELHHGLLFSQTSEARDTTRERVCVFKCVHVHP